MKNKTLAQRKRNAKRCADILIDGTLWHELDVASQKIIDVLEALENFSK